MLDAQLPAHVVEAQLVPARAIVDLFPPQLVEPGHSRGVPPQDHRALGEAIVPGVSLGTVLVHLPRHHGRIVQSPAAAYEGLIVQAGSAGVSEERQVGILQALLRQPARVQPGAELHRAVHPQAVLRSGGEHHVGQDLVHLGLHEGIHARGDHRLYLPAGAACS